MLIKISLYRGDSTGAFALGRRHTGGDLTIDLPAGTDACDISTFTIWCEAFSAFFTRLEVPATLFVSALTVVVVCSQWGGGGGAQPDWACSFTTGLRGSQVVTSNLPSNYAMLACSACLPLFLPSCHLLCSNFAHI